MENTDKNRKKRWLLLVLLLLLLFLLLYFLPLPFRPQKVPGVAVRDLRKRKHRVSP